MAIKRSHFRRSPLLMSQTRSQRKPKPVKKPDIEIVEPHHAFRPSFRGQTRSRFKGELKGQQGEKNDPG